MLGPKSVSYFGLGRWPNGPGDPRIFQKQLQALDHNFFKIKAYITGTGAPYLLHGIEIIPSGWPGGLLGRLIALPSVLLKMLNDEGDIIWIGNMEVLPLALLVKFIQRKKLVYDAMEHWPDMVRQSPHIPKYLRNIMAFIVDIFEKIFAKYVDLLITADSATMERYSACPHRLVNYNFPQISTFEQTKPNLKKQLHDRFFKKDLLIYVGSLGWDRGLREMLLALGELRPKYPNLCLAILGEFQNSDWSRDFNLLVAKLKLEDALILVGYVPQEELGEYLRAASIGISFLADTPKHHKNIATKQFDYMACGIPVVASNLAPMRDFIGTAGAGLLVSAEGHGGLAKGIDWLLANPVEAHRMGLAGFSAIRSCWNWEVEAKRLDATFKSLFVANFNGEWFD